MIKEIFAPVTFPIDGTLGPAVIFKDVTPIYLKVNFLKWSEIGLAEAGALLDGESQAIKYLQTEFIGLIDAVFCLTEGARDGISEEKQDACLRRYFESYYKKDAKKNEMIPPIALCKAFYNGITLESARSMFWLLMKVVAAHKDKYEYRIEEVRVLNLYDRFAALITNGQDWEKIAKNYDEENKSNKQ